MNLKGALLSLTALSGVLWAADAAAWPIHGSGAYQSGFAGAPNASPLYPTILSGEAHPPPWPVADVTASYGLGPHTGTTFKVVGTDTLPAGASLTGTIVSTTGTVSFDGWDFTGSTGYGLTCSSGNLTVLNSTFKVGAAGNNPIYISGSCTGSTVEYNKLDGNLIGTLSGALVTYNGAGTNTLEYNQFVNSQSDYINTNSSGLTQTVVMKYNSFGTFGSGQPIAHPDLLQVIDAFSSVTIDAEFNTIFYDDSLGWEAQLFTFGDNYFTPLIQSVTLANNTFVLIGSSGAGTLGPHYVYLANMSEVGGPINVSQNYIDPTGWNSTLGLGLFNNNAPSPEAVGTGSITGPTLTISAMTSGNFNGGLPGGAKWTVAGAGVAANTYLSAQTSGTSGVAGTYTVGVSQTVGSETISAYDGPYWAAPGTVTRTGNINMVTGASIP